jgi:hypothetical protein
MTSLAATYRNSFVAHNSASSRRTKIVQTFFVGLIFFDVAALRRRAVREHAHSASPTLDAPGTNTVTTKPAAVDSKGVVVGAFNDNLGQHGFIWQ